MDDSAQSLMRSGKVVLGPFRIWSGRYLRLCKIPGELVKQHIFLASQMDTLLVDVVKTSLDSYETLLRIGCCDSMRESDGTMSFLDVSSDDQELHCNHYRLVLAALAEYHEMSLQDSSFPWGFVRLLEPTTAVECVSDMKDEWEWLLELEKSIGYEKWARLIFHTGFQCYRKVMVMLEQSAWILNDDVLDVVRGYWHEVLVQSVVLEESFADITQAVKGNRSSRIGIQQVHAVHARSLKTRYPKYAQPVLDETDFGDNVSKTHEPFLETIFKGELSKKTPHGLRLADVETGLGWVQVNAHDFSRKHLNGLRALRITDSDSRELLWSNRLLEAGDVLSNGAGDFCVVIDKPPNLVKVGAGCV